MIYLTFLFTLAAIALYIAAPRLITKPIMTHTYDINVFVRRFRRAIFVTTIAVLAFAFLAQLGALSTKAAILFVGATLVISVPFLVETRGFGKGTAFGERARLYQAFCGQRILVAITSLYSFANTEHCTYELVIVLIMVNLSWTIIPMLVSRKNLWWMRRPRDMKRRIAYTAVVLCMLCALWYLHAIMSCWMIVAFLGLSVVISWAHYWYWRTYERPLTTLGKFKIVG